TGWIALASLVVLYGMAFTLLFVCVPRLNMAQNAPVMNVEPIATLLLGWTLLDQALGTLQVLGAAVVVCAIVLLTYRK
uniref:EamA family transporter n=2 Tax=Pseudomonadota TaxID=1224 RepID=UPI003558041E